MSKLNNIDNQPSFWGYLETPEVLPIRNAGTTRRAPGSWRRRAYREAGAQRSLPLRLREVVSRTAAWSRAAMMALTAPTIF